MGKRLIRAWLEQPLLSPAKITLRQNAVAEFLRQPPAARFDHRESDRHLRPRAHYDACCLRFRKRQGSARSFGRHLGACRSSRRLRPGARRRSSRRSRSRIDALEGIFLRAGSTRRSSKSRRLTIREGGIIRAGAMTRHSTLEKRHDERQAAYRRAGGAGTRCNRHPGSSASASTAFSAITSRSPNAFKDKTPSTTYASRRSQTANALHHPGAQGAGKPHPRLERSRCDENTSCLTTCAARSPTSSRAFRRPPRPSPSWTFACVVRSGFRSRTITRARASR